MAESGAVWVILGVPSCPVCPLTSLWFPLPRFRESRVPPARLVMMFRRRRHRRLPPAMNMPTKDTAVLPLSILAGSLLGWFKAVAVALVSARGVVHFGSLVLGMLLSAVFGEFLLLLCPVSGCY